MDGQPYFRTTGDGFMATWTVIAGLCRLIGWLFIGLAHLALLWALALLAWWHHLTPEAMAALAQSLLQSTTAATLGAAGLSASTLLAAWLWLMRAVQRRCAAYAARIATGAIPTR